jgi:hypothetical protein
MDAAYTCSGKVASTTTVARHLFGDHPVAAGFTLVPEKYGVPAHIPLSMGKTSVVGVSHKTEKIVR